MTADVVSFPARGPVVFVDPVESGGGEWAVFIQRPGQRASLVTVRFAYDAAELAARQIAAERGATFLDDTAPEPKGVA